MYNVSWLLSEATCALIGIFGMSLLSWPALSKSEMADDLNKLFCLQSLLLVCGQVTMDKLGFGLIPVDYLLMRIQLFVLFEIRALSTP